MTRPHQRLTSNATPAPGHRSVWRWITVACVFAVLGCAAARAPQPAPRPSAAEPGVQPAACRVASIENIVPASAGVAVSPVDPNLIAYGRPDEQRVFQIRVRDLRSGSDRCITCEAVPGAPAPNRHKGSPAFLADGRHIVVQAEMAQHPFEGQIGAPGAGWFNDLWVVSLDGKAWWPLTKYPSGPRDRYGALLPQVAPDGVRIAWAQLYRDDEQARAQYRRGRPVRGAYGHWQINVARLVGDAARGWQLEDVRSHRPGDGTFFETQDWSPDGQRVLFSSDMSQQSIHALDLWTLDPRDGRVQRVTSAASQWIEFGSFSPDGKRIAFASSECCGWQPTNERKSLRMDLYLMDADGRNSTRLTFANERGHSHAEAGGATVTSHRWSHDGRRIYFEMPFYGPFGGLRGSWLKMLQFEGPCGRLG